MTSTERFVPRGSNATRPPSTAAQTRSATVYALATGIVGQIFKVLSTGVAGKAIPEHTKDAFFQLWCDLRTNVPKDSKWLQNRAAALKPRTIQGWIALSSLLLFTSAGGCGVLCVLLAAIAVATYTLLCIGLIAGFLAVFWMVIFSGICFISSLFVGWIAGSLFLGYAWFASTVAVVNYVRTLSAARPVGKGKGKSETDQSEPTKGSEDSAHKDGGKGEVLAAADSSGGGDSSVLISRAAGPKHSATPHSMRNSPQGGEKRSALAVNKLEEAQQAEVAAVHNNTQRYKGDPR